MTGTRDQEPAETALETVLEPQGPGNVRSTLPEGAPHHHIEQSFRHKH